MKNNYKHYRYDIITAHENGVEEHPQKVMRELGYIVVKSEPVSIADCWWFRVENHIDHTPPYITQMPDNFKFSGE